MSSGVSAARDPVCAKPDAAIATINAKDVNSLKNVDGTKVMPRLLNDFVALGDRTNCTVDAVRFCAKKC
jgi:hypothetical protein